MAGQQWSVPSLLVVYMHCIVLYLYNNIMWFGPLPSELCCIVLLCLWSRMLFMYVV